MTTRAPLPPPPRTSHASIPAPPQRGGTVQSPVYGSAPPSYGPPPQQQPQYGAPASGYAPPPSAGYGPPPTAYAPPAGYGPPPAPMPANAYAPPASYGAPPPQPGYGNYSSMPPTVMPVGVSVAPKKNSVPIAAVIGGAAVLGVMALVGIGATWAILQTKHRPLPVEAAKLPSDTDFFQDDRFPGADGPAEVRDAFLSADMARHVCGAGSDFADRVLRLRTTPVDALSLFDPKTLEARRSTLECGREVAAALESPSYTELVFHDGDDKKFLGVEMIKLKLTELPSKYGFARQSFSGTPGFCLVSPKRTDVDLRWAFSGTRKDERDGECTDASLAAFRDETTWFFGPRTSIEAFARAYVKPRKELSTTVENLQLAFDSGEGLAVRRADARPKAASSMLKLPCTHAAFDSGAGAGFIETCLPKSVEKNASSIDAKVRAVTYELDAPIQDSDGIRFNLFFVARDNDAAKDVEADLKDAARDWKDAAENDEAKLGKLVREGSNKLGQRKWSVALDPFLRAIKNGVVARKGRVVSLKLAERFSDSEKKEIREVMSRSNEDMLAASVITQAVTKGQPVPEATLAQIVGAEWAGQALSQGKAAAPVPGGKSPVGGDGLKGAKKTLQ